MLLIDRDRLILPWRCCYVGMLRLLQRCQVLVHVFNTECMFAAT